MGATMTRAGAVSMGMPIMISTTLTRKRMTQGEVLILPMASIIIWGIWSAATIQANGSERPSSSMIMADSRPEARSTLGMLLRASRL